MVQNLINKKLIEDTLILESFLVKVLFDTRAIHSFIANDLAK